ncbi:MAG: hypothetical protein ABIP33_00175 [Pseudolysinimonas sp.]
MAILVLLAVVLCAVALWAVSQSAVLDVEVNHLYGQDTGSSAPTQEDMSKAAVVGAQAAALVQLVTPFVTASMLCVTAVLALLAWRWQLRASAPAR